MHLLVEHQWKKYVSGMYGLQPGVTIDIVNPPCAAMKSSMYGKVCHIPIGVPHSLLSFNIL